MAEREHKKFPDPVNWETALVSAGGLLRKHLTHRRIRKAISKLRAALNEAAVDDHLLVTRSGSQKHPDYTIVLRFG
jgi:hypothetical protein